MPPIRSITFVVNTSKPGADVVANQLKAAAEERGVDCSVTDTYPLAEDALEGRDLCCAIGGDGTLLGVLEAALRADAPVLGINRGKLGFLATFSAEEAAAKFPALIRGDYRIGERTVLECATAGGHVVRALNDIVIKETEGKSLVRLQVSARGDRVSEYHCDGLVFSSPTGSTAYNLSAGGPIIDPDVSAIAMTPICPHTLGNRSVIFGGSTELRIVSREEGPCPRVSYDGKDLVSDASVFPLRVVESPRRFKLMQNPDHSHFAIVRNKLQWGDPAIQA